MSDGKVLFSKVGDPSKWVKPKSFERVVVADMLQAKKEKKSKRIAKRKELSKGKPKLKSRKWLIRNLDIEIGREAKVWFIKQFGPYCVFCDFRGVPRNLITVWFHVLSRGHYSARWHEWNSLASCNDCNLIYERDPDFIAKVVYWYKEKYGQHQWDDLYRLWHKCVPVSTVELRELWEKTSTST